jgi:NitT/TauT family transport system substrate-binding protein
MIKNARHFGDTSENLKANGNPPSLTTLFCLGIIFLLVRPALAADALQKMRIVHASRSNAATPQFLAQSKGFYKSEGIDPELIQINPRLAATAVVNGDAALASAFLSTFRATLQGYPMKLVFIALKKGPYFIIARSEIKELEQLKGKKLGVATIRGADHLVAEEMLVAKGVNPTQIQALNIGDAPVRMQALISGAVDAICVSPPHDFLLQRMGYSALAGPPALGLPGSGLITSDRLLRENPNLIKRTLRAVLRAHRFIFQNKSETLRFMTQWLPQPTEVAEHAYEQELKNLTTDGLMSDAELDSLITRLGDKRRPLDEIRDFTLVRQALKELEAGR